MNIFFDFAQVNKNKLYPFTLLIFMFFFGITLEVFNYFELKPFLKGDSLSYLLFPFENLEEALSSHRTFGLPLIVKIYNKIFNTYQFWPYFQYFLFCLSVIYIFHTLKKIGISGLLSFSICISLLFNHGMVNGLGFIETETSIQTFLILILSFSIKYSCKYTKFNLLILNFLIFYIYQIRPNMGILVFLVPFWTFLIGYIFQKNKISLAFRKALTLLVSLLVILITFISVRYYYTSNVGLAAFGGTVISGQATSYLNKENIKKLSGIEYELANKILIKKNNLTFPCNKAVFTEEERHFCGNSFIVSAWLSAIELINGTKIKQTESEDPALNHKLASYFSVNNIEIDSVLKSFSYKVLAIEKEKLIKRYSYEIVRSMEYYFNFIFHNFQFIALYTLFFIYLTDYIFFKKIKHVIYKVNICLNHSYELLLIFQIISLTLLVSGVFSSGALIHLDQRYLAGLTTFILPSFFLILPTLINKK
jgi:hypothetical protein